MNHFLYKTHRRELVCVECGARGFDNDAAAFSEHMVSKHGYICEGRQTFKRRFCACGKPALYTASGSSYCGDHKHLAVKNLKQTLTKFYDPACDYYESERRAADTRAINRANLHSAKAIR